MLFGKSMAIFHSPEWYTWLALTSPDVFQGLRLDPAVTPAIYVYLMLRRLLDEASLLSTSLAFIISL